MAVSLLVDLQAATCEDDEDRADEIRDALDTPLTRLSWAANEWLRGLSGDLDMLCGREVFEPSSLTPAEYQQDLEKAVQNLEGEPETMLVLLRKEQNNLPSDVAAYFRGRAYFLLGLHHVGAVFLRRAIGLNPECIPYQVILLGGFWSAGDFGQARLLAEAILQNFAGDHKAFFLAAGCLTHLIMNVSPDNRVALGKLRRQVEKVLRSLPTPETIPGLAGFGFMLLGEISETLNRTTQALDNYSQACILMPGDTAPFLLRGCLMFKSDEQKALPDFRSAVNLGASDPLPYLVLARESLKTGDYTDCQALCLSVIKMGGPMVQGQAYEFMAIAEAQAHGTTDLAQRYFIEARRLFPLDSNIQRNQAIFEQAKRQSSEHESDTLIHAAKYQFNLNEINGTVQNDPLDLTLWTKSSQVWAEDDLLNAPLNMPLSRAA